MDKRPIAIVIAAALVMVSAYWFAARYKPETSLPPAPQTPVSGMSEADARAVAERTCVKGGEALARGTYNEITRTWWFDANLNMVREGCNPACVVSEGANTAEINWRCTGLKSSREGDVLPLITNFRECVAAGNPVLESYPRQCEVDGKIFIEEVSQDLPTTTAVACNPSQRGVDVCAQIYDPVCAQVEVQCIRAPCPPIAQTFSNTCEACRNSLVSSYTSGACAE